MADSRNIGAEFAAKLDEARWLARQERWDEACQAVRIVLDGAPVFAEHPDAFRRLQDQARALLAEIDGRRQRARRYHRSGYSRTACAVGALVAVGTFAATWAGLGTGPALAAWLGGAAFLASGALLDCLRERALLLHCHGAHHVAVAAGALVTIFATVVLRSMAWGTWAAWMVGSVAGCVVFALLSAGLSRVCPPDEASA